MARAEPVRDPDSDASVWLTASEGLWRVDADGTVELIEARPRDGDGDGDGRIDTDIDGDIDGDGDLRARPSPAAVSPAPGPAWLPTAELGVRWTRGWNDGGERHETHEVWFWLRWRFGAASTMTGRAP